MPYSRPLMLLTGLVLFAHAIHLLGSPNGVEASNWLGYKRSTFWAIVISFSGGLILMTGKFSNIEKAWHKFLDIASARPLYSLPPIGLCITAFIQILIWPGSRLSPTLLSLRENFSLTFLWAIPALLVIGLGILRMQAASRQDFFRQAGMVLLLLGYVNLRIANALTYRYAIVEGDAVDYIGQDDLGALLEGGRWWSLKRPFLLPLIGTLLKKDGMAFAWLQTLVSIFSWSFLAYAASSRISKHAWQLAAFSLVLLFSAQDRILIWDWSILSESFTLSLMALLAGCWILMLRAPGWSKLLWIIVLSFLWAFTRDINSWLLLLGALLILPSAFITQRYRSLVVVSLAFVLIFFASVNSVNSSQPPRWTLPYMHVLIFDIWPNPDAMAFFESHGLTVPRGLLARRAVSLEDFYGYLEQPDYADFRAWLFSKGQSTLARHLISNIPHSLTAPLNAADGYPIEPQTRFGRTWDREILLPDWLNGVFTASVRSVAALLFCMALCAFALLHWTKNHKPEWALPLAGLVLSYPYAFLSWHGDAYSRSRHVFPADILLRLSLLLLLVFAIEALLGRDAKTKS